MGELVQPQIDEGAVGCHVPCLVKQDPGILKEGRRKGGREGGREGGKEERARTSISFRSRWRQPRLMNISGEEGSRSLLCSRT